MASRRSAPVTCEATSKEMLVLKIPKEELYKLTEKLPDESRKQILDYAKGAECAAFRSALQQCEEIWTRARVAEAAPKRQSPRRPRRSPSSYPRT